MKHSVIVRVAVISDIHANLPALEAVVNDSEFQSCDQVLFAGDLVGYYYWPFECFQLLQELNVESIRGNHEDMLFEAINESNVDMATSKYGSGLKTAIDELPQQAIQTISAWEHPKLLNIGGRAILMCHGSPSDISQYLYPDIELPQSVSFQGDPVDVVIHGHTHYPAVRQSNSVLWVNPGSVGQPRNRQPGAHWAILDTDTLKVEAKVTPYDYSLVVELAKLRDPQHPYLWEVLQRG